MQVESSESVVQTINTPEGEVVRDIQSIEPIAEAIISEVLQAAAATQSSLGQLETSPEQSRTNLRLKLAVNVALIFLLLIALICYLILIRK